MPETEKGIKNNSDAGKSCLIGLLMAELNCAVVRIITAYGFQASDIDGLINPVCLRNMIIREEFKSRHAQYGDYKILYRQIAAEFKMSPNSVREIIQNRR